MGLLFEVSRVMFLHGSDADRDRRRAIMSMPHALIVLFLMLFFGTARAESENYGYAKPADRDKCPVCGMFVAKYPDWVSEVRFRDGSYAVFDGPKDLFKYLSDMKHYASGRPREDIRSIYVMDYYAVSPIDGTAAFYVTGGDVRGPMGAEFVPFEKETDAREFLKDHGGKSVLRFKDITPAILDGLE